MGGSLRGRDFRLLVLSTGLSSLGDELALIALAIKVADLTDSGWAVAALLLAGLLPLVIFAPAAGVIVDNFETRRSLMIASALQAGIAGWLAFPGSRSPAIPTTSSSGGTTGKRFSQAMPITSCCYPCSRTTRGRQESPSMRTC